MTLALILLPTMIKINKKIILWGDVKHFIRTYNRIRKNNRILQGIFFKHGLASTLFKDVLYKYIS